MSGIFKVADFPTPQEAHDRAAAVNGAIEFPVGTTVTDTIRWDPRVSLRGEVYGNSIAQGLPGKDVFRADSTAETNLRCGSVRDLIVKVDDSTDVSASFPQRGGVGNAGMAWDAPDGSVSRWRLSNWSFENVRFETTSFQARNASCGMYMQRGANLSRFRNVSFWRFVYGWWDHYPTSNLLLTEFANDHNHWDSLYANLCTNAVRMVNGLASQITNLVIHGGNSGFQGVGVRSAIRGTLYGLMFNSVYIEAVAGPGWSLAGEAHTIEGMAVNGVATDPFVFATNYSSYKNVSLMAKTNSPLLTVSGNYNVIEGVRRSDSPSQHPVIADSGTGNRISTYR